MTETDNNEQEKPSKSQRKREMIALQKIGESLVHLSSSQLAQIPLSDDLLAAINFVKKLKSHESIRRQLQYVGKMMREIDIEPIETALKKIKLSHHKQTEKFHEVEEWREQLIAKGDEALQQLLASHPQTDRQKLRQLIRKAQHDRANKKNTGAESEIFKYLRNLLSGGSSPR